MSTKVSPRMLVIAGLVIALLVAGVASFYASGDPDGLTKTAEEKGISAAEKEHGTAEGPLAGYETKGVDDARLSGGMAGVVGSLTVLLVAVGVVLLVRRRRPADVT
jgi:cobalt/nickel transport protein